MVCNCRKEENGIVIYYFSSKRQGETVNYIQSSQEVVFRNNVIRKGVAHDSVVSYGADDRQLIGSEKSIDQKAYGVCLGSLKGLPEKYKKIIQDSK